MFWPLLYPDFTVVLFVITILDEPLFFIQSFIKILMDFLNASAYIYLIYARLDEFDE